MPINPTSTASITVTPNSVRYSFAADRLGGQYRNGRVQLQRGVLTAQNKFYDDPRPAAKETVALPASCEAAVGGIIAVLPSILNVLRPNLTVNSITNARLRFESFVNDAERDDYRLTVQVDVGGGQWLSQTVPSLRAFLQANAGLVASVTAALTSLDTALNTENAAQQWV